MTQQVKKSTVLSQFSSLPQVLIGEGIKVFQLSMNLGVPGVRLFVTRTAGESFTTEAAECQTTKKNAVFPFMLSI